MEMIIIFLSEILFQSNLLYDEIQKLMKLKLLPLLQKLLEMP